MSITVVKGDLLKQEADAIINTVNCVGVMGKGIALQFKRKWPENYKAYVAACKAGQIRTGKMFVYDLGSLFHQKPRFIINFPTKDHWKEKSKVSYIEEGLRDLVHVIQKLNIKSIAIPPLGCGNGGLEWKEVKSLIEEILEPLKDKVDMRLFEPHGAPEAIAMETRTAKPNMTIGRAVLIKLISIYSAVEDHLSRLEIQKLCYFAQEAGEPLRLNYIKNQYGPYADTLRHVLNLIEGHYLIGVGDYDTSMSQVTVRRDVVEEVDEFLKNHSESVDRINSVAQLVEGFEDPYGMELLATVHWVCKKEIKAQTIQEIREAIYNWQIDQPEWNKRKRSLMPEKDIYIAWKHLSKLGWIDQGGKTKRFH